MIDPTDMTAMCVIAHDRPNRYDSNVCYSTW